MEDGNANIDYSELEKLFPIQVDKVRLNVQAKYQLFIPKTCDNFIIRCLRTKDGDLEKATKLVKAFHAAAIDFPNWDAILRPSPLQDFYDTLAIFPLAKRDPMGRRIIILRGGQWEPKNHSFDQIFACSWMLNQFLQTDDINIQREGFITVWDFANFNARHAFSVNHRRFGSLARWCQNGVLGRIKEFHIINHAWVVNVLYTALKPFLSEKLKKRIMFHNSMDKLHNHVSADNLPTYIGGKLDGDECVDKQFMKDLLQYDPFFEEMMSKSFPSS